MNSPSSRSMSSTLYGVVRILLLTGIIGYLAWQILVGWDAIRSMTVQWDALNLAGALISGLLAYQCLLLGWLLLLRRTGHYRPGQLALYSRIWWVSFLYRYVPGKVMLLVERARMGSAAGIPAAAGGMFTIIETLLSILAGSAVSMLAVLYYTGIDNQLMVGVAALAVGMVFLLPPAYRLLCGLSFVRKRYPELQSLALNWRDVIIVTIPYVCYYLLLGASFFLVSSSLQLFSWSDLPGLCGIYALSHVVSLLTLITPAGLGVREGAFAVQLGRLAPQGVAGALALGARLWFTLIELLSYAAVISVCPGAADRSRTAA